MDQYHSQLDNMKMFKEVGGVEQYFQLLLDMEFIRFETTESTSSTAGSDDVPTLTAVVSHKARAPTPTPPKPKAPESDIRRQETTTQNSTTDYSDEVLFDNVKELGVMRGKISAEMATTIEQYAKPEDTWSLLMELEGCNNDTELLLFLTVLAKGDHGPISRKMTSLMKSLKKSNLV